MTRQSSMWMGSKEGSLCLLLQKEMSLSRFREGSRTGLKRTILERYQRMWRLVRAAIADGTIATPQEGKDKALEQADREAAEKEAESDIRPDAAQPDSSEPVEDS